MVVIRKRYDRRTPRPGREHNFPQDSDHCMKCGMTRHVREVTFANCPGHLIRFDGYRSISHVEGGIRVSLDKKPCPSGASSGPCPRHTARRFSIHRVNSSSIRLTGNQRRVKKNTPVLQVAVNGGERSPYGRYPCKKNGGSGPRARAT
jgi:hypothetical protein